MPCFVIEFLHASAALPALQCLRSFSLRHSFAHASGLAWAFLVCGIFKLAKCGRCQSCSLHPLEFIRIHCILQEDDCSWCLCWNMLWVYCFCLLCLLSLFLLLRYLLRFCSLQISSSASGWSADVGAVAFEPKAAAATPWKDDGGRGTPKTRVSTTYRW